MLPPLFTRSRGLGKLYGQMFVPVLEQWKLTQLEADILLFLANNPQYDTAAEIIEVRRLAKSHVSTSLKALELSGFLKKHHEPGNKKTVHLTLADSADSLIADGRQAQEQFFHVICQGLTREEIERMEKCFQKIQENIKQYLEVHL